MLNTNNHRHLFKRCGRAYLIVLICVFVCISCTVTLSPLERMRHLAQGTNFQYGNVKTSNFDLVAYSRLEQGTESLTVYIEGDGQAWRSRSRPSFDPSPAYPLGFLLAKLDPEPSVVYIARPCQFAGGTEARNCDIPCWTSGRFSREAVQSIDEAISQIKRQADAKKIHLVGYSGGGAVALLVAGMRKDVISVRTVAGNLDHEKWTGLHGVTPLTGSLNAKNYAAELCEIPQIHYLGGKDSIMPEEVAYSYLSETEESCPATIKILPDCTHSKGWTKVWPELCSSFYLQF